MFYLLIVVNLLTYAPEPLFFPFTAKGYALNQGESFISIDPITMVASATRVNFLSASHCFLHNIQLYYSTVFLTWSDPTSPAFVPMVQMLGLSKTFLRDKTFSPFVGGSFGRIWLFALYSFYSGYMGCSVKRNASVFTANINGLKIKSDEPDVNEFYPLLFCGIEHNVRNTDIYLETMMFKDGWEVGVGFGGNPKKNIYVQIGGIVLSSFNDIGAAPILKLGYLFK